MVTTATQTTDSSRSLEVILDMSQLPVGDYVVTLRANSLARTVFILEDNLPLRPKEGDLPSTKVPGAAALKQIYLSAVRR